MTFELTYYFAFDLLLIGYSNIVWSDSLLKKNRRERQKKKEEKEKKKKKRRVRHLCQINLRVQVIDEKKHYQSFEDHHFGFQYMQKLVIYWKGNKVFNGIVNIVQCHSEESLTMFICGS